MVGMMDDFHGAEPALLRLDAEIWSQERPEDVPGTLARAREALALARELDMKREVALCHWTLARVCPRTDSGPAADDHDRAVALFREMHMPGWIERM